MEYRRGRMSREYRRWGHRRCVAYTVITKPISADFRTQLGSAPAVAALVVIRGGDGLPVGLLIRHGPVACDVVLVLARGSHDRDLTGRSGSAVHVDDLCAVRRPRWGLVSWTREHLLIRRIGDPYDRDRSRS